MEKVKAWLQAHWKPVLAVALAGGVAFWFLTRKKSGASALTIPTVLGGAAGGPQGAVAATAAAAAPASAPAAPSTPDPVWNRPRLAPPSTTQAPSGRIGVPPAAQRGSGFRGGDLYPPFAGMTAKGVGMARVPKLTAGPAAPLGTPIIPKQTSARDVRVSPRRTTAITQVARATDAVPLPQSFSVPIREHVEGTRPVLTIQAQTPVNATQAPDPQTPARVGYTAPTMPPSTRRRWRY